jgi:hypothetical protein
MHGRKVSNEAITASATPMLKYRHECLRNRCGGEIGGCYAQVQRVTTLRNLITLRVLGKGGVNYTHVKITLRVLRTSGSTLTYRETLTTEVTLPNQLSLVTSSSDQPRPCH